MATKPLKVGLTMARAVFVALGFAPAKKWDATRALDKVMKLNEMGEDDLTLDDADLQATVTSILAALEKKQIIDIVDDTEDDAPAVPAKPAKPVAKTKGATAEAAKETNAAGDELLPVTPPKKPAKPAKEAKAKEEKPPKDPGIPGVRPTRTRPYLAGIIIKKATRAAGITDAMVAELDEAYGKKNPAESMFCLRNAWHAIRGYVTKDNEGELEDAGAAE